MTDDEQSGTPVPTRAPAPRRRRSTPAVPSSGEQIPTQPCPTCGGRGWRLRSTLAADGYWLWVCAACADRRGDVAATWPVEAPVPTVDEDLDAGAATIEGLFGGQDGVY